jgi:hypothetical protein
MKTMNGLRVFAIAMAIALTAPALAAETYEQALQRELAASDRPPVNLNVPDDVKVAFRKCWASGFVSTQVPPEDVLKLDKLAAAGNTQDPLVTKYHDLLDMALYKSNGPETQDVLNAANRGLQINVDILNAMKAICPDVIDAITKDR